MIVDVKKRVPNGLFISFEGPECAGKSTQKRLLATYFRDRGYDVLETREPGGTRIGEELRHLVKHVCGDEAVCDEAELFVFCASRVQLMRKVILPFLEDGGIVICDRFADSTTAYQGYGRGLDMALIQHVNRVATAGRWPDVTYLMDLDIDEVLKRGQMRLETLFVQDRIEDESRKFHERVRQGFLNIQREHPERIQLISAIEAREAIHDRIIRDVESRIAEIC